MTKKNATRIYNVQLAGSVLFSDSFLLFNILFLFEVFCFYSLSESITKKKIAATLAIKSLKIIYFDNNSFKTSDETDLIKEVPKNTQTKPPKKKKMKMRNCYTYRKKNRVRKRM